MRPDRGVRECAQQRRSDAARHCLWQLARWWQYGAEGESAARLVGLIVVRHERKERAEDDGQRGLGAEFLDERAARTCARLAQLACRVLLLEPRDDAVGNACEVRRQELWVEEREVAVHAHGAAAARHRVLRGRVVQALQECWQRRAVQPLGVVGELLPRFCTGVVLGEFVEGLQHALPVQHCERPTASATALRTTPSPALVLLLRLVTADCASRSPQVCWVRTLSQLLTPEGLFSEALGNRGYKLLPKSPRECRQTVESTCSQRVFFRWIPRAGMSHVCEHIYFCDKFLRFTAEVAPPGQAH